MSAIRLEQTGAFDATIPNGVHYESLISESGWHSGGTTSRECWKILPYNNYNSEEPDDRVYLVKKRVHDSRYAMRNHIAPKAADDMYVTSAFFAAVVGRIAYNKRKGIHKAPMKENPTEYVRSVMRAFAQARDVDAAGAYITTVKMCGITPAERVKAVEFLNSREAMIMDLAEQIARHKSEPLDGMRCIEIEGEGADIIAVMSREYNSGSCEGIDRQHFQNYLPCGYLCRLENSSLKTCFCKTEEIEKTFMTCDAKVKDGKREFMMLLNRTHYLSVGCLLSSFAAVVMIFSLLFVYFSFREPGVVIKDDIQIVLLSLASGIVLFFLCKYVWYSSEMASDVLRGRCRVKMPADLGISVEGDLLRRMLLHEDAGSIFNDENSCAYASHPRGRLTCPSAVKVKKLEEIGVFVAEKVMMFAGKRGLEYYRLERYAHGLYHNTWEREDGLIISAWADYRSSVGGPSKFKRLNHLRSGQGGAKNLATPLVDRLVASVVDQVQNCG